MSLGMFCAIPLPFHVWDDDCMNLMLPALPLVGALIGAVWWGVAALVRAAGVHLMLAASALAVTPFLLTGFLHLDGYLDTSDAVLSRRPLDDRLRILKDPHMGAFAVIMAAVLFMLQFAACYAVLEGGAAFATLVVISVMSRCLSCISILRLPAMRQSGYANMFKKDAGNGHVLFAVCLTVAAAAFAYWLSGWRGLAAAAAVALGFAGALAYAYKEFGGISGDLTGFSLVIGELCGLIALGVAI